MKRGGIDTWVNSFEETTFILESYGTYWRSWVYAIDEIGRRECYETRVCLE